MSKKVKLDLTKYFKNSYYPTEPTSFKQARRFKAGERELPLELLEKKFNSSYDGVKGEYIVHWFRNDLRIKDNTGLYHTVKRAKELEKRVAGLYVISTKFWIAHLESPWKIYLILESLKSLRKSLNEYNIPLRVVYLEDHEKKVNFPQWFQKLIKVTYNSNTVSVNLVYEYDELKRDLSLDLNLQVHHDLCVVKPLSFQNGSGGQYSKFSPWFKKWEAHVKQNKHGLLEIEKLPSTFTDDLNKTDDYSLLHELQLSQLLSLGVTDKDITKFKETWCISESEVQGLVHQWFNEDVKRYENHDLPSKQNSSRLSPYLAIGSLSPRYVIRASQSSPIGLKPQVDAFIREVAFRDFYKNVVVAYPYIVFDIPFQLKSIDIPWENDQSHFEKWAFGKTGFPIVDASMRQLLHTGYLNNRCRMIVSSFLAKDLSIDWRWGEAWFHHHLVDADFASNNAGWEWTASVGVDAQPWFRIFNVYLQSERFDPKGDFIRTWVPELKDVKGKNIHKGVGGKDYPPPIVDREEAKDATLEKYSQCMKSNYY